MACTKKWVDLSLNSESILVERTNIVFCFVFVICDVGFLLLFGMLSLLSLSFRFALKDLFGSCF